MMDLDREILESRWLRERATQVRRDRELLIRMIRDALDLRARLLSDLADLRAEGARESTEPITAPSRPDKGSTPST